MDKHSTNNQSHILVTGAAGFIGCNFIRFVLNKNIRVTALDKLTYAGRYRSIVPFLACPKFDFIKCDINNPEMISKISLTRDNEKFSAVVNFAAETHVDRSISDPELFFETNVMGVQRLILSLMKSKYCTPDFRFIQVSTDEVFGSVEAGSFHENTPYKPNSPYAASKASADHLVRAAFKTYDFPAIITNCSNNFGPFQFPEKLIPLIIINALNESALPVYGDGTQVRDWLYVEDHCSAILSVLERGKVGESYMIGANNRVKNIEMVNMICDLLDQSHPRLFGKSYRDLIMFVRDRPGHDQQYAVNPAKIQNNLGWSPQTKLAAGLKNTISWYLNNQKWWRSIGDNSKQLDRFGINRG